MARGKSRPKRWAEAIDEANKQLDAMEAAKEALGNAFEELDSLRGEYEEWQGNLPENLQSGDLNDKLQAVVEMDFSERDDIDAMRGVIQEAEGVDLPRGFGRD